MASAAPERVPTLKKLAYAAPAFALAVVGIPIYVYLPKFYTDTVGIDIAALGVILGSVRIFDAVTDPPMGYLSDRTVSRFGRRRPYIAFGAVFVALFLVLLFNPPQASPAFETIWFGACIYALFLFWTIVTVPYEALGPEITYDYNAMRSSVCATGCSSPARWPPQPRRPPSRPFSGWRPTPKASVPSSSGSASSMPRSSSAVPGGACWPSASGPCRRRRPPACGRGCTRSCATGPSSS
jgi:hypothetical protein